MAEIVSADVLGCAAEAAQLLSQGELVCYPTDTVYGIGAAAGNDAAVRRLFAVKGRPLDKPMPLLIAETGQAFLYAETTPVARSLAAHFWPGGLTMVMRKAGDFRSLALANQEKVALRVPDWDITRDIIHQLGEPVTGTSANRSGGRTPVSAQEAAMALGEVVALVIDGGPSTGRQESTVIDITIQPAKILREGVVSREEIESILGSRVV